MEFVLSHPFAQKTANGWGTERFLFKSSETYEPHAGLFNPADTDYNLTLTYPGQLSLESARFTPLLGGK
jgi:hypothetical protein